MEKGKFNAVQDDSRSVVYLLYSKDARTLPDMVRWRDRAESSRVPLKESIVDEGAPQRLLEEEPKDTMQVRDWRQKTHVPPLANTRSAAATRYPTYLVFVPQCYVQQDVTNLPPSDFLHQCIHRFGAGKATRGTLIRPKFVCPSHSRGLLVSVVERVAKYPNSEAMEGTHHGACWAQAKSLLQDRVLELVDCVPMIVRSQYRLFRHLIDAAEEFVKSEGNSLAAWSPFCRDDVVASMRSLMCPTDGHSGSGLELRDGSGDVVTIAYCKEANVPPSVPLRGIVPCFEVTVPTGKKLIVSWGQLVFFDRGLRVVPKVGDAKGPATFVVVEFRTA